MLFVYSVVFYEPFSGIPKNKLFERLYELNKTSNDLVNRGLSSEYKELFVDGFAQHLYIVIDSFIVKVHPTHSILILSLS